MWDIDAALDEQLAGEKMQKDSTLVRSYSRVVASHPDRGKLKVGARTIVEHVAPLKGQRATRPSTRNSAEGTYGFLARSWQGSVRGPLAKRSRTGRGPLPMNVVACSTSGGMLSLLQSTLAEQFNWR